MKQCLQYKKEKGVTQKVVTIYKPKKKQIKKIYRIPRKKGKKNRSAENREEEEEEETICAAHISDKDRSLSVRERKVQAENN